MGSNQQNTYLFTQFIEGRIVKMSEIHSSIFIFCPVEPLMNAITFKRTRNKKDLNKKKNKLNIGKSTNRRRKIQNDKIE